MTKSDFAQTFITKAEELKVDIKSIIPKLTDDDDVNKQILSEWISEVYPKNKGSPKTNISELLLWTATKLKAKEDTILECKPPLGKGDLTFKQVKGAEKEIEQLKVNYIYPFQYPMLFPSLPKGILLYGVPGTGKTFLIRAATGELPNVAFFAPLPSELKGKYEGDTEKNIAMVFKCADATLKSSKQYSSAAIFFDEMDSIAGKRGEDPGMVRSVNSLLQSMDGIIQLPNVSVIGATNYPWSLDDAVLRRFTSRIMIDLPTDKARKQILEDGIAKAYGDPWNNLLGKLGYPYEKIEADRSKRYNNALKNIENYGSHTETVSGRVYGSTDMIKYLTDKELSDLTEKMGITSDGNDIRNEILNNKTRISVDDSRLNKRGLFGYSSSDIDKVLQIAIQKASERSLNGYANVVNIDGHCFWVYNSDLNSIGDGIEKIDKMIGKFWAFNKDEVKSCDDKKKDNNIVPMNKLVVSFDIRLSDFVNAMLEYPSTVDNRNYVKVLSYSVGIENME